jgi:hypothetical protein
MLVLAGPAMRSYSTFMRLAASCSGTPPVDGNRRAARQSPGISTGD